MATFAADVADLLEACAVPALSSSERGTRLEDLIAAVFTAIPGVEVRARNARSFFDNEELDLVMTNSREEGGLPMVGPFFSVECKNWSHPVGSTELSWFATKLRRSNQELGVLVAANGITGTQVGLTAAHFEAATALAEGQQILILTLPELSWLSSGEELAELLIEKLSQLIARREIYLASEQNVARGWNPWPQRIESRKQRDEALAIASEAVGEQPGEFPAILDVVASFRIALDRFVSSENEEPYGEPGRPLSSSEHESWNKANHEAFLAVIAGLDVIAQACIQRLRVSDRGQWPLERLVLSLDTRVPRNLNAEPDSSFAALLLDYWVGQIQEGFDFWTPALSLLSWSIEWVVAMRTERWPSPWV
jgi:hypothetical protein